MAEARVRISLTGGELEIEGSENFIGKYDDVLGELLQKLQEVPVVKVATKTAETNSSRGEHEGGDRSHALPAFGEVLHGLPKGASGTDQVLLAGYYAQRHSPDSTFATADANKLLVEQGVKLPNPSQSLNNNQGAKRVFKVGKRWKVGKPGEDYLKTLGVTL